MSLTLTLSGLEKILYSPYLDSTERKVAEPLKSNAQQEYDVTSRSCRKVLIVLSLCESCALTIREEISSTNIVVEMTQKLEEAAREARKQLRIELSKKEADKITQAMRHADLISPEFNGNLAEQAVYYTSLALGLLDELFEHIQNARKLEHLEHVERALRELCDYFDNELESVAIYEQAGRSVGVWLECMQQ